MGRCFSSRRSSKATDCGLVGEGGKALMLPPAPQNGNGQRNCDRSSQCRAVAVGAVGTGVLTSAAAAAAAAR